MPVSPPPTTTTRLPSALITWSGGVSRKGRPSIAGDRAVALVEVVHREVHAGQLAAGHVEVAVHARADGDHDRVVLPAELPGVDVAAHVDVADELDALVLEQLHAPVDDPLLELRVGHAEAEQAAGRLVALVDGDAVAELVQLGGDREARGPRADHGHRAVGALLGRVGLDPALLEAARDDRQLDLLDRHGVVVDVEHAGRLARGRADQPGELGEVVGRVELRRARRASGRGRRGRSSRGSGCRAGSPRGRTGCRSPCSARPGRAACGRPAAGSTAGSRATRSPGSRFSKPTRSRRRNAPSSPILPRSAPPAA